MRKMLDWRVIKTEYLEKGRFEIVYETVQFTPDYIGPYSYVRYKADGVCVLPVLSDGNICLTNQYRRPVDSFEFEVPAGMIDSNETPLDAAKRELAEETGYSTIRTVDCGFIYASPGSSTEKMYLFIAYCEKESKTAQNLDKSEKIDVATFSVQQIQRMIVEGRIHHSATQVLFYRLLGM